MNCASFLASSFCNVIGDAIDTQPDVRKTMLGQHVVLYVPVLQIREEPHLDHPLLLHASVFGRVATK
eukprot:5935604-Amphidinium_carterae.1